MSTRWQQGVEFEEKIAEYTHMPRAVACNSGTSGLHLAMLMAGVGRGDEVLAPALTFIAAVNPIRYAGAEPVFIGCGESLCLCPALAGEWLAANTEQRDGKCVNRHGRARESASGGACVRQYGQYARAGGAVPEVRPGPH
ncbi:MAG: aminotransferase class I/II-fold pyridoxal phosphate-dependent enzyme [Ruthenibacterium lactatiformans]